MRERGSGDEEDVLASIRRLVQAELGALGVPSASRRTEVADALVLTPSLRVGDTIEAERESQPFLHTLTRDTLRRPEREAPATDPVEDRSSERRRRTLEERIAELEAAVDPREAEDYEPDGSEDQRQHTPRAVILSHPNAKRRPSKPGPSSDALASRAEALSREGRPVSDLRPERGHERGAERGADRPSAHRPAGQRPSPHRPAPERPSADRPVSNRQASRPPIDPRPAERPSADRPAAGRDEQGADRVIGFTHRRQASPVAPPRPIAPEPPAGVEPETRRPAAGADPTPPADRMPGAPAVPTPAAAEPSTELAAALGMPSLAGALDEAMIREIVAEVVREELRGRLGERITRNVRKLVRSEIRRMLATEGRH